MSNISRVAPRASGADAMKGAEYQRASTPSTIALIAPPVHRIDARVLYVGGADLRGGIASSRRVRRIRTKPLADHASHGEAAKPDTLQSQVVEQAERIARELLDGVRDPAVTADCPWRRAVVPQDAIARSQRGGISVDPTSSGSCPANWTALRPAHRLPRQSGSEVEDRRILRTAWLDSVLGTVNDATGRAR